MRDAEHDRLKARRHGIVQGMLDADTQAMLRRLSEGYSNVPGSVLCDRFEQLEVEGEVREGRQRLLQRRSAVCERSMDEASLSLLRQLSSS
jgi:hypothetical protein